jgi:hypothetical protein
MGSVVPFLDALKLKEEEEAKPKKKLEGGKYFTRGRR